VFLASNQLPSFLSSAHSENPSANPFSRASRDPPASKGAHESARPIASLQPARLSPFRLKLLLSPQRNSFVPAVIFFCGNTQPADTCGRWSPSKLNNNADFMSLRLLESGGFEIEPNRVRPLVFSLLLSLSVICGTHTRSFEERRFFDSPSADTARAIPLSTKLPPSVSAVFVLSWLLA